MSDKSPELTSIKTGFLSRRLGMAKTGLIYGARSALSALGSEEDQARQRTQNAEYLVQQMGELKGSIVKVGQIIATYGEYLLPAEVAEALHGLEDNTPPMAWSAIAPQLQQQLGAAFDSLSIEPHARAAASLAQVHYAKHADFNHGLCLKVQYPGVAKTIDADFNDMVRLLRLSRMLESGRRIDNWLNEVKTLLHREVDYRLEASQQKFATEKLSHDPRFVVPQVIDRLSTEHLLSMSWEEGLPLTDDAVQALPQERRNALGKAIVELFFVELFDWKRMQSDPNFGNYKIRINDNGPDQWVLLDFGAMREIPDHFAEHFGNMIAASWHGDRDWFLKESIILGFMQESYPEDVLAAFADIGMDLAEPLRPDMSEVDPSALNERGEYHWQNSNLPKRIAKRALKASISMHFALPPTEFMFAIRKLMGVYALVAALDAQFNGSDLIAPYVEHRKPTD